MDDVVHTFSHVVEDDDMTYQPTNGGLDYFSTYISKMSKHIWLNESKVDFVKEIPLFMKNTRCA